MCVRYIHLKWFHLVVSCLLADCFFLRHFLYQEKLLKLNQIVWPEIWRLTEAGIAEAHASGHEVCVVDAAVLLQAGWQDHLHEVWVTIAPIKEVGEA